MEIKTSGSLELMKEDHDYIADKTIFGYKNNLHTVCAIYLDCFGIKTRLVAWFEERGDAEVFHKIMLESKFDRLRQSNLIFINGQFVGGYAYDELAENMAMNSTTKVIEG